MKKQAAIAVLVAITWAMSAATGVAQSVSGLSVKTREAAEPVAAAAPDMTSKTVIDLFAEYLAAGSNEERDALLARISRLRIAVEDNKATELARKRAEARQAIIDAPDEATRQERKRALARLRADDPPVSLAVPAGATAAVGEDKSATAGPVLGFQAWRPDDFFAGAFFTFDTPARLNGDGRRANEFLRNPPATGTSFYASASKIVWAINRNSVVGPITRRLADDGQQVAYLGFATRMGVTNATLERKVGDEVVAKEAFIFHFTPALLVTSRTFREASGGEYQFGAELGLASRLIGGDAAQDKDFLSAPDVLGTATKRHLGFDGTLFVRLNAFQPFVRVTYFGKDSGAHQAAFSGVQATFGINVQSSLFQTAKEK